jgi:hypothetical protein
MAVGRPVPRTVFEPTAQEVVGGRAKPIGIRIRIQRRIVLPETTYLSVVIAGLDPVIPSDSGGYAGARIKSGHDGVGMDCPCPDFIIPLGRHRRA